MVTTTDAGMLAGECTLWIDTLRSFRNKFQNNQSVLMQLSADPAQQEVLLEIEHLHNQLYIQLVNIHDLKQAIKKHLQRVFTERSRPGGYIQDDLLAGHEYLYEEYQRLDTTLHHILREFDRFIRFMARQ